MVRPRNTVVIGFAGGVPAGGWAARPRGRGRASVRSAARETRIEILIRSPLERGRKAAGR
jgi:hypothetical protein